jgi:hypothetical protein
MPSSVFDVICPGCGGDMELSAPGEGQCRSCGAQYLVRIGHLIPIAPPRREAPIRGGAR